MRNRLRGIYLLVAALVLLVILSTFSAQHVTDLSTYMTETADTSGGHSFETVIAQGSQTLTAQPGAVLQP